MTASMLTLQSTQDSFEGSAARWKVVLATLALLGAFLVNQESSHAQHYDEAPAQARTSKAVALPVTFALSSVGMYVGGIGGALVLGGVGAVLTPGGCGGGPLFCINPGAAVGALVGFAVGTPAGLIGGMELSGHWLDFRGSRLGAGWGAGIGLASLIGVALLTDNDGAIFAATFLIPLFGSIGYVIPSDMRSHEVAAPVGSLLNYHPDQGVTVGVPLVGVGQDEQGGQLWMAPVIQGTF